MMTVILCLILLVLLLIAFPGLKKALLIVLIVFILLYLRVATRDVQEGMHPEPPAATDTLR